MRAVPGAGRPPPDGRRRGSRRCRPAPGGRGGRGEGGGAPGPRPAQPGGHGCLGVGVHGGGGLDQQQHLRVRQQGTDQPQPLALTAGEVAALGLDHGVQAIGQCLHDVLRRSVPDGLGDERAGVLGPAADHGAQRAGEEVGVVVRHQDPAADLGQGDLGERHAAPGRSGCAVPAEPVDHGRGIGRASAHDRGQPARYQFHPGVGVVQDRWLLMGRPQCRGVFEGGLQVEHPDHPSSGHQTPGEVVSALDEVGDRYHQDGDVAVDGDQRADRDGALGRHPGGQPGHQREEEGGQADRERLDPAGHGADPVPLGLQVLRSTQVAAGHHLLAADAVEYAHAADDVAEPGGQRPLLRAVLGLRALEAFQQRPDHDREQRHPQQDHEGERDGDRQQQRGRDQVRDDGTDARTGDRQCLAHLRDVAHTDAGHLAGRHLPGQFGTQPSGVRDHDLDGPEGGVHPDPRHDAVAHDAEPCVEQPGADQCDHPADQDSGLPPLEPVVDRTLHEVRRQQEADHPEGADHRTTCHPSPLTHGQPPQVTRGASVIRGSRVGIRIRHE